MSFAETGRRGWEAGGCNRGARCCARYSLLVRPLSTHPRLTAPRPQVLHSELGDSKYRPSPLLVQHVNAGWLGKKSGRGFYDYRK